MLLAAAHLCGNALASADQAMPPASKSEAARFEVVSVKLCGDALPLKGIIASPGGLRLRCLTVDDLIRMAYITGATGLDVPAHRARALVKRGPAWIRSTRFTIEAKTAKPFTTEEMLGLPLREILTSRFALRVHEQTQALAVYDLIQQPAGAKLQLTKDGNCLDPAKISSPPRASGGRPPTPLCGAFRASPGGGIDGYGIMMSHFCMRMSFALDRDVVDKTGLAGAYDLHLETTLDEVSRLRSRFNRMPQASESPIPEAPGGSIFTALRRIGLELKPSTRLAKVIVIDDAKMPEGN